MAGNTFGKLFCVTSFGESHGAAIGGVVDGCPPGLLLDAADLQEELDRRRPGTSKFVTQRNEPDTVEILSGVFHGQTTGTPIAFLIRNQDARSQDYQKVAQAFRPGHADYTYFKKYGIRDYRGGGRASARETAVRVAAGAIAKKWLARHFGVAIRACVTGVGEHEIPVADWTQVSKNPFFIANPQHIGTLETYLETLRREGDSCGASLFIEAKGVPAGWGAPVYDRLDADIAYAMMSINAVKAVEIGEGVRVAKMRGTENADQMSATGFLSNHAGGVLGGISSGETVVVKIAVKPTPSITSPLQTINEAGEEVTIKTTGRHDPCVGIRAVPVAEAMLALVLIDHALGQRVIAGR